MTALADTALAAVAELQALTPEAIGPLTEAYREALKQHLPDPATDTAADTTAMFFTVGAYAAPAQQDNLNDLRRELWFRAGLQTYVNGYWPEDAAARALYDGDALLRRPEDLPAGPEYARLRQTLRHYWHLNGSATSFYSARRWLMAMYKKQLLGNFDQLETDSPLALPLAPFLSYEKEHKDAWFWLAPPPPAYFSITLHNFCAHVLPQWAQWEQYFRAAKCQIPPEHFEMLHPFGLLLSAYLLRTNDTSPTGWYPAWRRSALARLKKNPLDLYVFGPGYFDFAGPIKRDPHRVVESQPENA